MILVVCAVAAELRGFARAGVRVVPVGVGPVEAALGAARALSSEPWELVINAGIGGGFAGRTAVGDTVAVTREHYVELGREDHGELSLPNGLQLIDSVAADARLLERLSTGGPHVVQHAGPGVTSATITTSADRAALIDARYAPLVESMEGFAVLRAAAAAGIAAVELRGISNIVGDRASSQWDFRAGSAATVGALSRFLDALSVNV